MLSREYILKGKKNFENVQKEGRLFQSSSFGIAYLKREDTGPSRFGFVVSTKIAKEAVQRNRIKRALSEAVRFMMKEIKEGYEVVFLAKQRSAKEPTDVLMREVREAMPKAKLTK
jgi:ribonuclease P protein component